MFYIADPKLVPECAKYPYLWCLPSKNKEYYMDFEPIIFSDLLNYI